MNIQSSQGTSLSSGTHGNDNSRSASNGLAHWGWVGIGLLVLASALNYLDRQLLAAVAPTLRREFSLSNAQYGQIVSAFSLVYAFATPAAGLFVDRVGLRIGLTISVGFWSVAGALTAATRTFGSLLGCRIALGIAEASSIPSASKASASYLQPSAFGLGNALQSVGIMAGSVGAPLIVAALAPLYGWRSIFIVSGSFGLIWLLLWVAVSHRLPSITPAHGSVPTPMQVLRDRRLLSLAVANALVMTLFALWSNWTTIFFVQEYHLTQAQANQHFAWIPPITSTLGGLVGGSLAFRLIRRGRNALAARFRVCSSIAPVLLLSAAVPFMPSPNFALMTICLSLFSSMAIAINIGVMPIDLFGAERAAFSSSLLTCSYAMMQAFISPVIGLLIDHIGFRSVCISTALLPLAGLGILSLAIQPRQVVGTLRRSA